MVAGLKFLSKKAFNPQNLSNQKRVWEKEQQRKQEAKRIKEREEQLRRERDDEELAKARGDAPKLNFMYAVPPGLDTSSGKKTESCAQEEASSFHSKPAPVPAPSNTSLTERQPGDDDAAAAFRRMFASSAANEPVSEASDPTAQAASEGPLSFGTVMEGTTVNSSKDEKAAATDNDSASHLTALEKAVGRKKAGLALTFEEQVQRFPALANAPRARGMNATDVGVSFKPLGTQIRNIKCMACGVWGHSRGERECKLTGWNPFASSSSQQQSTNAATTTTLSESKDKDCSEMVARAPKRCEESDSEDSHNSSSDDSDRERSTRRKRKKSKHRHRRRSDRKRHKKTRSDSSPKRRRQSESKSSKYEKRRKHKHYPR